MSSSGNVIKNGFESSLYKLTAKLMNSHMMQELPDKIFENRIFLKVKWDNYSLA